MVIVAITIRRARIPLFCRCAGDTIAGSPIREGQAMLWLASIIIALATLPAAAQAPILPYPAVAVTLPPPPDDPSFTAFRADLAGVAARRVYAELARLVDAREFFWERDFNAAFAPGKAGIENLAAAIGLERGAGDGWITLAMFAAEPTVAPLASRPGIACAPARPRFDEAAYYRLIDRTATEAEDWGYPHKTPVTMHAVADGKAAVVETLGLHFVRVLARAAKDGETGAEPAGWTQVAAPSGKTGFVARGALSSLSAERLCYRKDITGRWRIAGFIGGD
jgi:hypothetical protein